MRRLLILSMVWWLTVFIAATTINAQTPNIQQSFGFGCTSTCLVQLPNGTTHGATIKGRKTSSRAAASGVFTVAGLPAR
jgi:hypothetical protein